MLIRLQHLYYYTYSIMKNTRTTRTTTWKNVELTNEQLEVAKAILKEQQEQQKAKNKATKEQRKLINEKLRENSEKRKQLHLERVELLAQFRELMKC